MAAFLIAEEEEDETNMNPRKARMFRDWENPWDYLSDSEYIQRYQLPRKKILDLCDLLGHHLEYGTKRNKALPPNLQILITLRFYACGSFFNSIGDIHGFDKSTVSRCVRRVTEELCRYSRNFIKFPQTRQEQTAKKDEFYEIAHFPNVLGIIDGTRIPIKAPSDDEHLYVCRKGFHSINAKVICDASLRFTDEVVKFPGCTHDASISRNSAIFMKFENNELRNGWLLGDSGYPLLPWLMTPIINPQTMPDNRYNRKQKST